MKDYIVKKTTPGGIEVVFDRRAGDRTVTCGIWIKTGSADDGQHSGISHLLEHMVFKGTEKRSQLDIVKSVESYGGNINAFTGRAYTCFYVKSLPEFVNKSIEILSDMVSSRRMDPKDLEMEKGVVIEENRMLSDQPDEVASEEFIKIMYAGSPHAIEIGGSDDSVNAISVDDILGYKIRRYTKDNVVVVVSGVCDMDGVMEAIDKGLEGLEDKKRDIIWTPIDYKHKFSHIEKDSNATHLMLGGPGLTATDQDRYAARIMALMLGGGMSSRLFQKVREEKGLVYSIYASNHANSQGGFSEIYTSTSHDKAQATISEVRKVLSDFKDGFDSEEVEMAKQIAAASIMYASENTRGRMTHIGTAYVVADELISEDQEVEIIRSLKDEDIRRVIDRTMNFDEFSGVSVGKGQVAWEDAWNC